MQTEKGTTVSTDYQEFLKSKRISIMPSGFQPKTITWGDKISKAISKLTDDDVREIRKLLDAKVSQYVIADQYSVHQGTISNIKRGRVYQWVK